MARICSGQWRPGDKIPSENAFVDQLGASRMTVNRALRELAGDGILERVQGVGTFVARRRPFHALLEIRDIAREISDAGGLHTSTLHRLETVGAPPAVARDMGIAAGASVFHVIIVHHDRGCPVQMADRYVNPASAPDFMAQDFSTVTPSAYLMQVAPVTEVEHVVSAVMPDALTRELLKMAPGEPCLLLDRTVWSGPVVATCNRLAYPGGRYRIGGRFRINVP